MRNLKLGHVVLAHFAEGLSGRCHGEPGCHGDPGCQWESGCHGERGCQGENPKAADDFVRDGLRYRLIGAVQHVTDPDHFIGWRRHESKLFDFNNSNNQKL